MKVEVISRDDDRLTEDIMATLEMEPTELPRAGEYISVERTNADRAHAYLGIDSFGTVVKQVSRHFKDGKIVSATILVE